MFARPLIVIREPFLAEAVFIVAEQSTAVALTVGAVGTRPVGGAAIPAGEALGLARAVLIPLALLGDTVAGPALQLKGTVTPTVRVLKAKLPVASALRVAELATPTLVC